MRVILNTSVVGAVDLPAGWEGELDEAIAADLIQAGHATAAGATKSAKPSDLTEKATSKQAAAAEKR